jgi:hypothetical protein
MLNDPGEIQEMLAHFERREAEQTRQLAYFAEHGPKHVYRMLVREFAKERQQIALRRRVLRGMLRRMLG